MAILRADPSTVLGSYRVTLAKAIAAASMQRDISTKCASSTWVGLSRVVFKDIHAEEGEWV